MGADVRFEIFGGVRAFVDGAEVAIAPQPRRLLGILLAERARPVATDTIIDRLWDGTPPRSASHAVHVIAERLRRVLTDAGAPGDELVTSAAPGYRIAAEPHDLDTFELTLAQVAAMPPGEGALAAARLDAALGSWRPPWGEQGDQGWLQPVVAALTERHRVAEEHWADLILQLGRHDEAIERLTEAAEREPLRERRWQQLIVALYRSDRQADALRTYERARILLRDELGVVPGPDLQTLHRAVLEHDPWLTQPETRGGSGVTSFVGRDSEMAALERMCDESRLVTVVGIGGIGKSRLAAEAVRRRRLVGEQARMIEIGRLADPSRLAAHVAAGLGLDVAAESPAGAVDVVAASLGRGESLVVLDAAEDAVDPVAAFVLQVLDRCPRVQIIVTSRVPIGLAGESLLGLGPLPIGDGDDPLDASAMALFASRAGLDLATLDDAVRNEIRQRCEAADGMPLLIELAAASFDVRHRSPSGPTNVSADLDTEAAVLGAIRHALDAVDTEAERVLSDIAVLPDGVTVDTAAMIVGTDLVAARRALRQLAWVRLVEARAGRGSIRYRSLDPVREAVSPTASDGLRDRAAAAVERVMRSVQSDRAAPPRIDQLDVAEDEVVNLRHVLSDRLVADPRRALTVATAAGQFWMLRGHLLEGQRWIESALAAHSAEGPEKWEAVLALAETTRGYAELAKRRPLLDATVEEATRGGCPPLILGALLLYQATACGWAGDREATARALDAAEEVDRAVGTRFSRAHIDSLRALELVLAGDVEAGRAGVRASAAVMAGLGDLSAAARMHYLAGAAGDLFGGPDVERDLANARPLAEHVRDLSLLTQLLLLEARLLRKQGSPEALTAFADAAERLMSMGGVRASALARRDLGLLHLEGGRSREAEASLKIALPLLLELDRPAAAVAAAALASLAAADGRSAAAAALAAGALDLRTAAAPGGREAGADAARTLELLGPLVTETEGGGASIPADTDLLEAAGVTL